MICSMGGRKQRLLRASFPCGTARTCQERKSNLERAPGVATGLGRHGQYRTTWIIHLAPTILQVCNPIESRGKSRSDSFWLATTCLSSGCRPLPQVEKLPRLDIVLVGMKTTRGLDDQHLVVKLSGLKPVRSERGRNKEDEKVS